jgi:hypothetical protein
MARIGAHGPGRRAVFLVRPRLDTTARNVGALFRKPPVAGAVRSMQDRRVLAVRTRERQAQHLPRAKGRRDRSDGRRDTVRPRAQPARHRHHLHEHASSQGPSGAHNQTLQDRLVKELRLQGVSAMEAGNAFLPRFMDDYNRRFGLPPRNPHDAHRPLRGDEDLLQIFTWQEERVMSRNLVVHFKQ